MPLAMLHGHNQHDYFEPKDRSSPLLDLFVLALGSIGDMFRLVTQHALRLQIGKCSCIRSAALRPFAQTWKTLDISRPLGIILYPEIQKQYWCCSQLRLTCLNMLCL